ncbi:MAG TPA: ABC transporter ATP-binding protein [Acidimicrobiia bacterium]|nr:ABC transporter ATP-binding protein [Acidimicrobiia bacterium]
MSEPITSDAEQHGRDLGWLRKLWPFLSRHKKSALIAFGVAIVGTAISTITPLISGLLIDHWVKEDTVSPGPWIALLVGLGALQFLFAYIRRFVGGRYALDVQNDIRTALFERLQRLDFARHDALPTGQLVSRASSDLTLVQMLLSFLPLLAGNVVMLVMSLAVMLWLSPPLTLVALLAVPALLVVSLKLRTKMYPAQWDALQHAGIVAGVVDESVTGVRVVKGFGQEDRELESLTDASRDLYRSRVRNVRIQAKYSSMLQTIPSLGQVGVLALGGWLAINGEITLGTFTVFSSYLVQLLAPVRMFAQIIAVSAQTRAAADRIFEILDSNPVVTEKPDARDLVVTDAEVVVDDVGYGYLASEPVLSGFTLRVAPGETVALVGSSGSGKSTVSMLLPRFYDVQRGAIRIDGTDVRDVTLESLRREVGVVFEDAFLFSDSVRNNIAYGRPDATAADIERAARVAGAHEFITQLPDGYDTAVGERGLTLSGGQRQRIAIARAVITDPRILLLDDATSSVDARTEEQIHATLREIMQHRTTILIAHRRSTLRLADRIVILEHGRAVEEGTLDELMTSSDRLRTLLAGPGDEAEGPIDDTDTVEAGILESDDLEPDDLANGALRPTPVTPELWIRDDRALPVRAFVEVAPAAAGMIGPSGGGGNAGGVGGGRVAGSLTATAELEAGIAALPPADDEPRIDEAAEAAGSETFRLRTFLRPYRLPLLFGFLLVGIDAGIMLLGPLFVLGGLERGVLDGSERAVFVASALYLTTTLADWLLTWGYTRYTGRTAERLLFALRIRIFAHLQRLGLDFYDREMAGRIMTRMTTDVDTLSNLLQSGLINALVSLISLVGVAVVLFVLSPQLTLAVLTVMPPLLVLTVWFRRRSRRAYQRARDAISNVNAEFQENLSGIRVTQAYAREDRNIDSFKSTSDSYLRARLTAQRLQAFYFPLIQFVAVVGDAIVLGYGGSLAHSGAISAAVVVTFILFLDQFFTPIQQLSQVFEQWQQATTSLDKIDELMQTPCSTPEIEHPVAADHVRGAIRFDDVHFAYPNTAQEILHGVSIDIAQGETVALVGTTGAGKSTLVKLAARFYDTSSGTVSIDGVPITDLDLGEYRRRLGYVPQEPFLFSGTIRDNIAYGRPDAPDVDVERAARAVGAHDFIAELPGGYLHPVTERGRSLSAGQKQLICLARAELVDPAILLLDEATANLDLSTEARVQRAMGLVASGRTTLLIAHRLPTARSADRILVVDDGMIVEQGTHDELLDLGGYYSQLWEAFAVEPTAA